MDDEPLSFEAHRRLRDENSVRCARCGQWIIATAIQCPKCGVHFQGEAQDFAHPSDRSRRRSILVIAVVLLLLAAMAAGLLGLR